MRCAGLFNLTFTCAVIFCASSSTQAGLVAHWGFENNLLDSSANANNLSVGTGTSGFGAAAPVPGSATAFSFNGSTMLVDTTPVNFGFTGPYTFAAWINAPFPAPNFNGWFWRGVPGGADIEVYQPPAGDLYVSHNRLNDGNFDYMGFASPPASTYYHLAVMFNGTAWTTYYNGVAASVVATRDGTPPLIATAGHQISLGKLNHALFGPNFAIGLMDEAFVFDQTLTQVQLNNLIAFNNIVPEPSTLALLGLGAIGLAIRTRRRRTAA